MGKSSDEIANDWFLCSSSVGLEIQIGEIFKLESLSCEDVNFF